MVPLVWFYAPFARAINFCPKGHDVPIWLCPKMLGLPLRFLSLLADFSLSSGSCLQQLKKTRGAKGASCSDAALDPRFGFMAATPRSLCQKMEGTPAERKGPPKFKTHLFGRGISFCGTLAFGFLPLICRAATVVPPNADPRDFLRPLFMNVGPGCFSLILVGMHHFWRGITPHTNTQGFCLVRG